MFLGSNCGIFIFALSRFISRVLGFWQYISLPKAKAGKFGAFLAVVVGVSLFVTPPFAFRLAPKQQIYICAGGYVAPQ